MRASCAARCRADEEGQQSRAQEQAFRSAAFYGKRHVAEGERKTVTALLPISGG
jgi:hypothetical protein